MRRRPVTGRQPVHCGRGDASRMDERRHIVMGRRLRPSPVPRRLGDIHVRRRVGCHERRLSGRGVRGVGVVVLTGGVGRVVGGLTGDLSQALQHMVGQGLGDALNRLRVNIRQIQRRRLPAVVGGAGYPRGARRAGNGISEVLLEPSK